MDPNICYDNMCGEAEEGDYTTAGEYARHLLTWLDNGGFPPYRKLADYVKRECRAIIEKAKR